MDKPQLQKIIEAAHEQMCYYFKIIPVKKAVYKGIWNQENCQEVFSNQEILAELQIADEQQKYFLEELKKLEFTKSGITFPAGQETWILLNPIYEKPEMAEKLIFDCVETIAKQVTHAVIFNLDIWRGYDHPYGEINKGLKDFLWRNYDWKKVIVGGESKE